MRFKFAQTRVVRYSVVIEADCYEDAYDQVFNHEEWEENGIESDDPPWQEDCPEDALPDVYVLHGYVIPASEYLNPVKEGMVGCDGSAISVGSRVMCKRGDWDGAKWYPATVTYLYDAGRDRGFDALVQEDDLNKKPHWMWGGNNIRVMLPEEEPIVDENQEEDIEEDIEEDSE